MFKMKETIKRKINVPILAVVLLSFCPRVFAQQQDLTKEDDLGKFLNELMDIKVVIDIGNISLYEIPTAVAVTDRPDIQQQLQKTNPGILWPVPPVNLTDYELYKWDASALGLYDPHPEKPDVREISILSYLNEPLNLQKVKFEDARLIEAILESEESMKNENPLMGLIWQINEDIDFAIVGQYVLDMTYPDLVDYMKNEDEDQTRGAIYAKLTLRF
jgi:hypothetical protein